MSNDYIAAYEACRKYYVYADWMNRCVGIPLNGTQFFDVRNIASKKLAIALNMRDLIVDCEIVTLKNGDTHTTGILMDEAEGINFGDFEKAESVVISPILQKEFCNLQILDATAKQCDRYEYNYNIILSDSIVVGIMGYDNDLSFNLNTDMKISQDDCPVCIQDNGEIKLSYFDNDFAKNIFFVRFMICF